MLGAAQARSISRAASSRICLQVGVKSSVKCDSGQEDAHDQGRRQAHDASPRDVGRTSLVPAVDAPDLGSGQRAEITKPTAIPVDTSINRCIAMLN